MPETPAVDAPVEDVPVEAPAGADLVITEPADNAAVIAVLDRHDEQLIVEELQRRTLKTMLYSFPLDGKNVTDLSYLGVNEAIRVMNNERGQSITIEKDSLKVESCEEDMGDGPEPCFVATVYAMNIRTGYGQWATAVQPKRMKLKDASAVKRARDKGRFVDDEKRIADKFARQKALSKAQRNALRVHIPEAIRQTLIAQYENDGERIRHITVGAGAESMSALPPPLATPEADEKRAQARAIYDRIREANPLAMLPAVFHAHMIRAESSLERLDDFIAALEQKLGEVTDTEAKQ